MKKKTILILLTAVAVLTVTGFVFADSLLPDRNEENAPEETLKPYEYRIEGDEMTIELEENPSTGYAWVYTVQDEAALVLVTDEFITGDEALLGASGTRRIVFKIVSEGTNEIAFRYVRSFEPEEAGNEVVFELEHADGTTEINVR